MTARATEIIPLFFVRENNCPELSRFCMDSSDLHVGKLVCDHQVAKLDSDRQVVKLGTATWHSGPERSGCLKTDNLV